MFNCGTSQDGLETVKKVRDIMKIFYFLITFLIFTVSVVSNVNASGSDIEVDGKVFNPSVGYYSALQGEFIITYVNNNTQYGDRVYLKYGFSGGYSNSGLGNHWAQEKKIEIPAVSDYQWSVKFENTVASRGSFTYESLDFVIIVTDSRGNEKQIDNGTNGTLSTFYRLDLNLGQPSALHYFYIAQ